LAPATAFGLSTEPKTKPHRIAILKEIARVPSLDVEEMFAREALAKPCGIVVQAGEKPDTEERRIGTLLNVLKQKPKQEIAE